MLISIRLALGLFLIVWLCNSAAAQTISEAPSSTSVTAASTEHGMRLTATADVVEMRLEIFSASGQKLIDTEFRRGNVFDWRTQDGAVLSTEPHLWVVTVKTLAGQLRQRHGVVSWQSGRARVQRIHREQIPASQTQAWDFSRAAQTLPPLTMDTETTSFNVPADRWTPAVTITTHDSEAGQVTSTAGALTFRTGDLFAGKDVERLRITEDGKVGIGTNNPQSALDVAGAVRASEGFRFPDGTTLTAKNGKLSITNSAGDPIATEATGTGTLNRVAKWTETGGAGTLGDSTITETGGNVGIGTTSPASLLHLAGPGGVSAITLNTPGLQRFRFQTIPGVPNWGGLTLNSNYNGGWFLDDTAINGYFFKLDTRGGNPPGPNNGLWLFQIPAGPNPHTDEVPIFGVTNGQAYFAGNLGIGTTTPTTKLHVIGAVNFTGFRTEATTSDPNVIGGFSGNDVTAGVVGATIGGGGQSGLFNRVTDNYGTVSGGLSNRAGNTAGSTGDAPGATVGGGQFNFATGEYSTVGGGWASLASGNRSTVPGGHANEAQGEYSFAAGRRAKALHNGSLVWADSTNDDFSSTNIDQFLIRARGGVGINTNDPKATLGLVAPTGNTNFFMRNVGQTLGVNFGVGTPLAGQNAPLFIAQYDGTTYLDRLVVNTDGTVSVNTLAAATATHLCRNGTRIADCSSSLRYKEGVTPFSAGLNLLNRLRPVTFKWKERDERDVGLIAEDVAQVEPLFVTHNAAGEIQGVKYDQLSVVLINAVKEQQTQIEQQQEQLKKQQSLIEGLKKLVCRDNPNAEVCK